ncbi:MAG TPA: signal peptidase I [Spirochaetia bacterium]|nr:signal peptidase I [Spirochaetia bacterium]
MIGSVEHYSSSVRKRRISLLGSRTFRVLIIAFAIYIVVSRFVVGTFRVESVSMEPEVGPADRVVVSFLAFGPRVPFSHARLPGLGLPQRGDLVMVQPPFYDDESLIVRALQPVVSFLTLQKATLRRDLYGGKVTSYMLKRVIGMPGDTIRLTNYKVWIRHRGASEFIAEDRIVPAHYSIHSDLNAPGWDSSLPFSGNEDEIVLKDGEYYVMGDNRPESSDSRSWGPVPLDRIVGKVLYRYWPPRSIGKL